MPRVSILTACYNQAHYLRESVASSLAQTERDIEVIIVNDGSADDTAAVANTLGWIDPRVKVVTMPGNMGLAAAQNAGVRASSGEWVLKLDADDRARPQYVEQILIAASLRPNVNCIFSPAILFGDGEPPRTYRYPRYNPDTITEEHQIPGPAAIKRTLWDAVGGLDETQRTGGEDWDFYVRAAVLRLLRPFQLREAQWEYRQHAGPRMSRVGIANIDNLKAHWRSHTPASARAQAAQWMVAA